MVGGRSATAKTSLAVQRPGHKCAKGHRRPTTFRCVGHLNSCEVSTSLLYSQRCRWAFFLPISVVAEVPHKFTYNEPGILGAPVVGMIPIPSAATISGSIPARAGSPLSVASTAALRPSVDHVSSSILRYAGSLIRIPPELSGKPDETMRSMISWPPFSRRSFAFWYRIARCLGVIFSHHQG